MAKVKGRTLEVKAKAWAIQAEAKAIAYECQIWTNYVSRILHFTIVLFMISLQVNN